MPDPTFIPDTFGDGLDSMDPRDSNLASPPKNTLAPEHRSVWGNFASAMATAFDLLSVVIALFAAAALLFVLPLLWALFGAR